MCGIFSLFLNRPLAEADLALARAGRQLLRHRGPDAEGEWYDLEAGVYLGHRRLSIIDPTPASNQPMARDGSVLCQNGEIYNYPNLKQQLRQRGINFTTNGDTEVLLRAWQTWGEETLDRLDAMFAFALWDRERGYLAVDPFGEKPLYTAETPDGLYVSSEIEPLATLLQLDPYLQGRDLAAYLSFGYVSPPATAYKEIHRVEAGTLLTVERGTVVRRKKYWSVPEFRHTAGPARVLSERDLDRLHEILVESVRGRLLADVPLCLFLSSGVDSSLVAAIASQDLGVKPDCITVSYPNSSVPDEGGEAAEVAAYLGLGHRIIETESDPSQVSPDNVLDLFGQPCESLTSLSVYQMCRAAASNHKVALTGTGGDEIFFGYQKHSDIYRHRHFYGLPEWLRRGLGACARPIAARSARLAQLTYAFGVPDHQLYVAHKCYPTIDWLQRLEGFDEWTEAAFGGPRRPLDEQTAQNEISLALAGLRLVVMDAASMRASLEIRTPFLNRGLVETIAEMDPRSFFAFGQKDALRRLLRRYLPEHLVDRPKRGFVFPQDLYLDMHGRKGIQIPGLAQDLVDEVWQRRNTSPGWRRQAVRLIALERFFTRHQELRQVA